MFANNEELVKLIAETESIKMMECKKTKLKN